MINFDNLDRPIIEKPSRRVFLQTAALIPGILGSLPSGAQSEFQEPNFWNSPRTIWMKRPINGEEIKTTYWADGELIIEEYNKLCWFMRDTRMEATVRKMIKDGKNVPMSMSPAVAISPILLDILYATYGWLEYNKIPRVIHLNSGYRHPITNANIEGAAKNSHHMLGGAGDITIAGISALSVSNFGQWLSAGGIGWYPSKGFTHVDDGKLRTWKGS